MNPPMNRRQFFTAVSLALGFALAPAWLAPAKADEKEALSAAARTWEQSGDYMTIDGHRVFYHDVGDGPVILLFHGHPSSSHDWKQIVEILKPKARLISFDHVGWGLSDKPEASVIHCFNSPTSLKRCLVNWVSPKHT